MTLKITPSTFFDLIDKKKLDSQDRIIYDGTKRFSELCDISSLSITNSGTYNLHFRGMANGSYFSFMGYHKNVHLDILYSLPDELLGAFEDKGLKKIITTSKDQDFHVLSPCGWTLARQMNEGLFEGAAQFDSGVKPPCLRIGTCSKYNEFVPRAEELAAIVNDLYQHHIEKVRGE